MAADSRIVATVERPSSQLPSTDLAPITVKELVARRALIKEAISEAMEEGVHYGVIPGTNNKLSLLKEGAEMLLSMFRIAVEPVVTDMSTPAEVRFRVECRGSVNGLYVGSGIGICSSNEEKYRWRKAKSVQEFEAASRADPNRVRIKYGAKGGQEYEERQVRQSPYDAIQTILSMAEKRAKVDLAKTSLAASECLAGKLPTNRWGSRPKPEQQRPAAQGNAHQSSQQPGGARPASSQSAGSPTAGTPHSATGQQAPPKDAEKHTPPPTITEEQVEKIARYLDAEGIPDSAFLANFEIGLISELPAARYEAATAWLERNTP